MSIEIGSFLDRLASIHGTEDTVVIFPAGRIEVFGDEDIVMDAAAAQVVIDGFNERGVKIPVDYEHSTLYKAGQGEASPAAGWITALSWDAQLGLIGTVEWGTEARRQIKAGEYKYLSPHFRIDRETRRVDHVLAVALTNTPRINNMRELVAATLAATENDKPSYGRKTMLKRTRMKLCSILKLKETATDEEMIAQAEEVVQPVVVPVEAPIEVPEELSAEDQAVIAVKELLLKIQQALIEADVIGVEASLADAMQAALDLIGKKAEPVDEPAAEPAAENAASIAAALGMSGKPTTAQMIASIQEKTATMVPAAALKKTQEEVAILTAERDERRATEIVGSLIEVGKLNPHDKENMKWARDLAKTDPDRLASLMDKAPALYKSDRLTPNDVSPSGRDTVIASAMKDFETDGCGASKLWYVNAAMDEKGLEHLNEDEAKKHAIK